MRMLVLGGSLFVGRAIAAAGVRAGWNVTTFNRGRSAPDLAGVSALRGDRTDLNSVAELRQHGPWDVVVDTSSYVPRNTLDVARALEPITQQYLLLSTVSVYEDWPQAPLSEHSNVLACPPDADADYGPPDVEDGPTRYGRLKAGCENAARVAMGSDRVAILRPGVILGPGEYVGRLPWWLRRIAAGGRVLAPGSPDRTIQPVDVRDLADFVLRLGANRIPGVFNVTAPIGERTFGGLLAACAEVTGSDPDLVWVSDQQLLSLGVRQWSELPLWRTFEGVWRVDAGGAVAAGLTCQPLLATAAATWQWMSTATLGVNDRSTEIGLARSREEQILARAS
jgi:2'-hydroxyisoflavone reductase